MSKFLKNLSSSGIKVHSRYSARGRGGQVGPSTSIGLNIQFPFRSFIDKIATKQRTVLFYSGRYAMRSFRTQLRRKPPAKFTKRGNIRKRYREEVLEKKRRPPYFRTGILYRSVDFVINEQLGRFDSGPPKITGLQKYSRSSQAVPGLLDQGGTASVRIVRRYRKSSKSKQRFGGVKSIRWESRRYRPFPYQSTVFAKTANFFRRKIKDIHL